MRGAWEVVPDGRPTVDLRPPRAEAAAILVAVLLGVLLIVVSISYSRLTDRITEACSATSAAAKLDLSGMVPLCRDFKENR